MRRLQAVLSRGLADSSQVLRVGFHTRFLGGINPRGIYLFGRFPHFLTNFGVNSICSDHYTPGISLTSRCGNRDTRSTILNTLHPLRGENFGLILDLFKEDLYQHAPIEEDDRITMTVDLVS